LLLVFIASETLLELVSQSGAEERLRVLALEMASRADEAPGKLVDSLLQASEGAGNQLIFPFASLGGLVGLFCLTFRARDQAADQGLHIARRRRRTEGAEGALNIDAESESDLWRYVNGQLPLDATAYLAEPAFASRRLLVGDRGDGRGRPCGFPWRQAPRLVPDPNEFRSRKSSLPARRPRALDLGLLLEGAQRGRTQRDEPRRRADRVATVRINAALIRHVVLTPADGICPQAISMGLRAPLPCPS